jgi:hypothetical protein
MEVEEIVQQIYLNRHPEEKYLKKIFDKFTIKKNPDRPDYDYYIIDEYIYIEKFQNIFWINEDKLHGEFMLQFNYNFDVSFVFLKNFFIKYFDLDDPILIPSLRLKDYKKFKI